MKPSLLIAAAVAWMLAAACGADPSPRVDGREAKPGKTSGSTERPGDASGLQTGPANVPSPSAHTAAPGDLGVPLFPGAQAAEADRRDLGGAEKLAAQQGLITSLFFSTDTIAEVVAFYRESLQEWEPRIYEMDLPSGRMINIMLQRGGKDANIVLSEAREKPGTLIRITRVAE